MYLCNMNLAYKHLLPADFDPHSRVWVYQSSRMLSMFEALELEPMFEDFKAQWNAHGAAVKGYINLFFGQFIVLIADETHTTVSGCSTDSSVRFIKAIEAKFKVSLFDRQQLAFLVKDKVELLPLSQIPWAIENNFLQPNTIYFNNLVATKQELENQWLQDLKDSWIGKRYLSASEA